MFFWVRLQEKRIRGKRSLWWLPSFRLGQVWSSASWHTKKNRFESQGILLLKSQISLSCLYRTLKSVGSENPYLLYRTILDAILLHIYQILSYVLSEGQLLHSLNIPHEGFHVLDRIFKFVLGRKQKAKAPRIIPSLIKDNVVLDKILLELS